MKRRNPSASHAAPTWKSQRFPRKTLPEQLLQRQAGSCRKQQNSGNSHSLQPGWEMEPGPEFHGNSRGVWNVLEPLVAQNAENKGKRGIRGILWVWEEPRDGFFPLPVWLQLRNSRKMWIFTEMSWFGWGRTLNPNPFHPRMLQPQSLDTSKDSSGNSSPFQAGIFPYFPSSQATTGSKA